MINKATQTPAEPQQAKSKRYIRRGQICQTAPGRKNGYHQQDENKIVPSKYGAEEDPVWEGGKEKSQKSAEGKESKVEEGFCSIVVTCHMTSCKTEFSVLCLQPSRQEGILKAQAFVKTNL